MAHIARTFVHKLRLAQHGTGLFPRTKSFLTVYLQFIRYYRYKTIKKGRFLYFLLCRIFDFSWFPVCVTLFVKQLIFQNWSVTTIQIIYDRSHDQLSSWQKNLGINWLNIATSLSVHIFCIHWTENRVDTVGKNRE
jgi:hypothetical protein